jgi:hypothetical protein
MDYVTDLAMVTQELGWKSETPLEDALRSLF